MTHRKKHQSGFTLVEILVVIVIIGLLATIVGTNVIGSLLSSKESVAKQQVLEFTKVVETYIIKEGRAPESLDVLVQENERGIAYMTGISEIPKDPWQNPYQLRPGERAHEFEIICFGPDGEEGTEDDISSKTAKDKK